VETINGNWVTLYMTQRLGATAELASLAHRDRQCDPRRRPFARTTKMTQWRLSNRMARRGEIVAVYIAGVIQGIALVTFPAASTVFTSPAYYGLTSTEYGGMFVPQAVLAIGTSLLGASFTRRLGLKPVYLTGLVANLLAMALLVISQFVTGERSLAYGLLLVATTCLGIGFGMTVPAINTYSGGRRPQGASCSHLSKAGFRRG
jgi:MFS family permease